MSDEPIIVEQDFEQPIEIVWEAITKHDQMIQWFFDTIPDFKPEVGFKTQFTIENEGREFTHLWEILEVITCKKIVYDWCYKEYEGKGKVSFELVANDNKTMLRLTSAVVEAFKADIVEFKRESGVAGWTYFINNKLKEYLNSK